MRLLTVTSALGLVATAVAQTAEYCPSESGGVCYRLNVPEQTASSGDGDIFFQIQGPSTNKWIAVGQGTGMAGANIFVVYADASGTNVTLSPRLGLGHVQPLFDSEAQAVLLEGSGISNGQMTANIRCSNCGSWSGGSMDFTSNQASWIWSVHNGSPLDSDSQSATLSEHTNKDTFQFDLTKARGGNSLNPFVEALVGASTTMSPSASTVAPTSGYVKASSAVSTASGSMSASSASSSSMSANDDDSGGGADNATADRATTVHGVVMGFTFVIVFPLGALLIRLCSFKALVWVHAVVQLFGYILTLTGLGLGLFIAMVPTFQLNSYHPIIGIIVTALLVFQPVLGLLHHHVYRTSLKTSLWSVMHVWLGRVAITLGIINGGLGLRLSDNTTKGEIAYGVIAGLVWLGWVGVVVWSHSKTGTSRS